MNSVSMSLTTRLIRNWVGFYTKGLPDEIVAFRREEIDSDLWEQSHCPSHSSTHADFTALHILARSILGIGDDISWRQEQINEVGKKGKDNYAERNVVMNFASMLIRPRTYINVVAVWVAMFLLFPIGIGAFVAAVVSVVVPFALIAAPFIYMWDTMEIGPFVVDTLPEALVTSLIGFVLLALVIAVANAIVSVLGRFVSIKIGRFQFGQRY